VALSAGVVGEARDPAGQRAQPERAHVAVVAVVRPRRRTGVSVAGRRRALRRATGEPPTCLPGVVGRRHGNPAALGVGGHVGAGGDRRERRRLPRRQLTVADREVLEGLGLTERHACPVRRVPTVAMIPRGGSLGANHSGPAPLAGPRRGPGMLRGRDQRGQAEGGGQRDNQREGQARGRGQKRPQTHVQLLPVGASR
jgi:hypothetical protein